MLKTRLHFDSPQQEAYLGLWRTYDRLREIEERLFSHWGLTAQQYNVLRLLEASHVDAIPTLSLATNLVSKAADITRLVDRLETRGWVRRERSKTDRRTVLVKITEAGNELLNQIASSLDQCHQDQLGHLAAGELEKLVELLRKVRTPHEASDSHWI